jgi:urea transport system permease protein
MKKRVINCLAILLILVCFGSVNAEETTKAAKEFSTEATAAIKQLVTDSFSDTQAAIEKLQEIGDPKVIPILQAMQEETLRKTRDGQIVILNEDYTEGRNVITGKILKFKEDDIDTLQEPKIKNSIRNAIKSTLSTFQLFAKNDTSRLKAATVIAKKNEPQTELEKSLRKAYAAEKNPEIKRQLAFALARIDISSSDLNKRLQAIQVIAISQNAKAKSALQVLLKKDDKGQFIEKNQKITEAAQQAVDSLNRTEFINDQVNNLFFGLSYGSVLLLAAVGLAITFGIMGVINMAHGATLMVGAFTTFTIQAIFTQTVGGNEVVSPWFLLAAIPCAFLVSGFFGITMERTVVKHLYGRPLDTLLATWGFGLILIQAIRLTFGATNQKVENPDFISGKMTLLGDVVIQYNRLAIIVFAIFVILVVWYILRRTSLGLQVRAVTQNRNMASSMGISTHNVDRWTFGLGSGIAGLGGVALSQAGYNVGPEMGEAIIIDCFMVVVLGGVGNMAGTILGALLIGIVSKFLEPAVGSELSKVIMLALVITFIQLRPQGMFALKGRAAEG